MPLKKWTIEGIRALVFRQNSCSVFLHSWKGLCGDLTGMSTNRNGHFFRHLIILVAMMYSAAVLGQPNTANGSTAPKVGFYLERLLPPSLTATADIEAEPFTLSAEKSFSPIFVEALLQAAPENAIQLLAETGAEIRYMDRASHWVSLAVSSAEVVAKLSELDFVVRLSYSPPPLFRAGSVTSRAAQAMRATIPINSQSLDGSGLKIGIVSDSFAQTMNVRDSNTTPAKGQAGVLRNSIPQDSGDLPDSITILNDRSEGVDEGAAMAELVHDIAPAAEIYFHSAGRSRTEMAGAIDALCEAGVDVIVDDVLFLFETVYQDDRVALAAQRCVEGGAAYFAAAGNDGEYGHRFEYNDINPAVDDNDASPSGNDLHNWSASGSDAFMRITIPAAQKVYIILNWNQPGDGVPGSSGAEIDLDLYVTASDSVNSLSVNSNNFVDRGANFQGSTGSPSGEPVEFVYLETGSTSETYYLAVEHKKGSQSDIPQASGVPLEFRLLYTGGDISSAEYPFNGSTTWGHVLEKSVIAIAAVPWWESPEYEPARFETRNIDPEPFTAVGGAQYVQFNSNADYQPEERIAPQFAAVDGNNNTLRVFLAHFLVETYFQSWFFFKNDQFSSKMSKKRQIFSFAAIEGFEMSIPLECSTRLLM